MNYKCKVCNKCYKLNGYVSNTVCPNCKSHDWKLLDKKKSGRPLGVKNKKQNPKSLMVRKYFNSKTIGNYERTVNWWYATGQITEKEYNARITTIKKYLTSIKK